VGLVALVGVVAVLVVGDRVAARVVAGRFADRLACAAGLARRPAVTIGGFPFTTQALSDRFGTVHASATGITHGGLRLDRVDATLRDVSAGRGALRIGAVDARVLVPYSVLPSQAGGRELSYGGDGSRLVIRTAVTLGGAGVAVTVYAVPSISGDRLTVNPREVEVFGIRRSGGAVLDKLHDIDKQLPTLPAGLGYGAVVPEPDGLRVTLTGHDLHTTGTNPTGTCHREE
jgi:hypothetical protein